MLSLLDDKIETVNLKNRNYIKHKTTKPQNQNKYRNYLSFSMFCQSIVRCVIIKKYLNNGIKTTNLNINIDQNQKEKKRRRKKID